MKNSRMIGIVSCVASGILACVLATGCKCPCMKHRGESGEMKKSAMATPVYACPDCHTMSLKAGACSMCKKDMQQSHLLGTEGGQAMLCACAAGCKCDAMTVKDGKCGCGKPVTKVSAKGMYVCPMGCPDVSDKPGKCACGMDMRKVE